MPINSPLDFRNFAQDEFRDIAYTVVGRAIEVHRELNRFSNEQSYSKAIRICLGDCAKTEVPVSVNFETFSKTYFLDLVINEGAIFELKKASGITDRHRSQLLNYLMLTNTSHGKLINFGNEKVEHEFLNCKQRLDSRRNFEVDQSRWLDHSDNDLFLTTLIRLLQDWGTGLDTKLYEEAIGSLIHKNPESILQTFQIDFRKYTIGDITVPTLRPNQAFRITALDRNSKNRFEKQLQALLIQTELEIIHWVNIHGEVVHFITIC